MYGAHRFGGAYLGTARLTSGGTAIARTASDSIGAISDSVAPPLRSFARYAPQSQQPQRYPGGTYLGAGGRVNDDVSASLDSASGALVRVRAIVDTSVSSDVASRPARAFIRTASDSFSVSDGVTARVVAYARSATDGVGAVSDTVSRVRAGPRAISDSIPTISDVATRSTPSRSASDSIAVSDGVVRVTGSARPTSDLVTISDGVVSVLVRARATGDSFSVADAVARAPSARSRAATDVIAVSDLPARSLARSRATSDSLGVADTVSSVLWASRVTSDSIVVTSSGGYQIVVSRVLGLIVVGGYLGGGYFGGLSGAMGDVALSTDTASTTLRLPTRAVSDGSTSNDASGLSTTRTRSTSDASSSHDSAGGLRMFTTVVRPGGSYPGAIYFGTLSIQVASPLPGADYSVSGDTTRKNAYYRPRFTTDVSISVEGQAAGRTKFGVGLEFSGSADVLSAQVVPLGRMLKVELRERAPLRLTVQVRTPSGQHGRWAEDDPDARNAPSGINFSTVMPGGFEQAGAVLQRDPSRDAPDLEELSTVSICGPGGTVAWQGRIESRPDSSGESFSVSPGLVGFQSHLGDNNSAREIFVDANISNWRGPSLSRQIDLQAHGPVSPSGPSIGPDSTTLDAPALITEIDDEWTQSQAAEAWYDSRGIPLAKLYAKWSQLGISWGGFNAAMSMMDADGGANPLTAPYYGGTDDHSITGSDTGTFELTTAAATRIFAELRMQSAASSGGAAGARAKLFWQAVRVYGRHGLSLYDDDGNPVASGGGVRASDVVRYVLDKFTPLIGYTADSIVASTFTIPQLAFLDSTTAAAMIKEAVKYELLDWAVWEGPIFYLNQRNARGRKWRAWVGPAQLQDAGPQIGRLWNGVVVSYQDVSGTAKTVGPPGSGADLIDAGLEDTDPYNPVNQVPGLKKWAMASMGLSTSGAAAQVGRIFLQEQKKLVTSGQAALTGHVQDSDGIWWPAWMVRAGDRIAFADSHDPGYRRVVHTSYDHASKTCTVQLDQPPDSLQAILERLSIVLAPFGLSG